MFHAAGTRPSAGTCRDSVRIRCWYQVALWLSTSATLIFNPRRLKQIDMVLKSLYDEYRMERITLG